MGREKNRRPIMPAGLGIGSIVESTAASSSLSPTGLVLLATTSTGTPVVYTLAGAPQKNTMFSVQALSLASSSNAPFHINAGSGIGLGASSEDMLVLDVEGAGATFVGASTSRWACIGSHGASFSTST